jgi:hypothetical protein
VNDRNSGNGRRFNGWAYDYMLSCPSILTIGYPSWEGMSGIALLTLLYPRVTLLRGKNGLRIVGDVPPEYGGSRIREYCMGIMEGRLQDGSFDPYVNAMFMGGFNVYLNHEGRSILIAYELVNTEKLSFYFKPRRMGVPGVKSTSIGDWAVFAAALREGDLGLLREACRRTGLEGDNSCIIDTGSGTLLITGKSTSTPQDFSRILVDNNGLRNVVKIR